MHVCHFCDTSFEGEFFRLMVTGLAERGVRVSLVELNQGSPPTWLADAPGATYRSLGAAGKRDYPSAVRRMARICKDDGIDILHTHLFFAGVIGVLTKWLNRQTIVVVMRHHTSVVRMLGWAVHIAADKWMAEKADHVITVSNAAKAYMKEVDGIMRSGIEVVHIGFDFEKLAPNEGDRTRIRREFDFPDDAVVMGYIATFVEGKGHMQLLDAFRRILDEVPAARLLLIGEAAGVFDEVNRVAAEFPPGSIVVAGFRGDVPACLNAMDIFIQPSLSEAFSRVIVEAMGVGVPVIATRVGGAAEVIEDGENGILVEPNDVDALRREAVRLCRDTEFRGAIGERGMLSVRERFTADHMVSRFMALYQTYGPRRAQEGSLREWPWI